MPPTLCLGLESSCDETAAAIVSDDRKIHASIIADQALLHRAYGGVVPEIAARAHAERMDLCVAEALETAGTDLAEIDLIAVTAGPGLIGGLLAGVMCAKGLAAARGLPLIGVNHLAGHALTPRLTDGVAYPYLMLLVSGGHCQILDVDGPQSFRRLGGTIDDAPGEAFDKTARLLSLGYPGGPEIERIAKDGDPARFDLPRPLLDRPGFDMSFSGLKTALRRAVDRLVADQGGVTRQDRADLAAGFQTAVAEVLAEKTRRALASVPGRALAVAGGVAANRRIGAALRHVAEEAGVGFYAPPLSLCSDNAAMIAWAGLEQAAAGARDDLTLAARPRWPLDQQATPMLGAGTRGAKA
ncbi:MAG: tRNA (adenosine(37)-N6)-threonylcarbamoyltransferase complex transferase subunit TsaD [Pseudomonadota bacterium]